MPSLSDQEAYAELAFYTLAHADPAFIHQHIVDAFAAQTAGPETQPVTLLFALVGLYLAVEKGLTGRQVQLAHMALAKNRNHWPRLPLPDQRGEISVYQVLAAPPGTERDEMIHRWCASVWSAYGDQQAFIRDFVNRAQIGRAA